MNNTLPEKMTFTFLIAPSKEYGYLGMCRETGFVQNGNDPEKLEKRLVNATNLLIDTVKNNPKCLSNLYCGLNWRNKITFYFSLARMIMQRFSKAAENFFFFTRNINFITPQYA
jgi:hypothetical protein